LDGVQAISSTCDHLGIFARSPRDAWFITSALMMVRPEIIAPRRPRRVVVLRLPQEVPQGDAYPERLAALADALRRDGVTVEVIDLPFPGKDFRTLQQDLCYWEAARTLLAPGRIRTVPQLRSLLGPYLDRDVTAYAAARRRQEYQTQFAMLSAGCDAVLLPAATGIAPPIADTGDAVMSRFWTALHVPAITIPLWRSAAGFPLGLQLLGGLGTDRILAEIAQWFLVGGHATSSRAS
jgi:Asp-tRNA(Asn)/Glu-tRNA(Gln) amidotransferase A subunit family amidase